MGEALIDLFPVELAVGPLASVERFVRLPGGAPANVAAALARQSIQVSLLSCVGRDAFGDFLVERLAGEGVDIAGVERSEARTGIAFVSWTSPGEREFLFYRHQTADTRIDRELVERHAQQLASAAALHLSGDRLAVEPSASALRRALELARAGGAAISFDLNLRFHLWPSRDDAVRAARELLPHCHLVKSDLEEGSAVTGQEHPRDVAAELCRMGAAFSAVTLGGEGAVYCCAAGAGAVTAPAVEVVDSTGAGDGFAATLLAGLVASSEDAEDRFAPSRARAEQLVARACWAGSRICTAVGATTALPRGSEIDRAVPMPPSR